jgi:phage tail-like protein
MATGDRKDPYQNFRYLVEIDGLVLAGFTEVSGLQAETRVETYREGGVNDYVHRLPGETTYPNIVLKRGVTDSSALWDWHQEVVSGKFSRKNGYVVLLDSEGEETWRWNFINAYPAKWNGPDLRSESDSIAFESIELAHNGIKKA